MFKSGIAFIPAGWTGTAPDAATSDRGTALTMEQGENRTNQSSIGVIVTNLEAAGANTLEVSFNGGHSWFTLATMTTITFPIVTQRINVRGTSGATADFSVMAIR